MAHHRNDDNIRPSGTRRFSLAYLNRNRDSFNNESSNDSNSQKYNTLAHLKNGKDAEHGTDEYYNAKWKQAGNTAIVGRRFTLPDVPSPGRGPTNNASDDDIPQEWKELREKYKTSQEISSESIIEDESQMSQKHNLVDSDRRHSPTAAYHQHNPPQDHESFYDAVPKSETNSEQDNRHHHQPEEYHQNIRKLSKTWQDKAKGRAGGAAEPEEYHPSVRKLSKTWQDKAKGRAAAAEPEEYHPSVRKLSKTWQDKAKRNTPAAEPEEYHPSVRKLSKTWQNKAKGKFVVAEKEQYHPSVRKLSKTWQDKAKGKSAASEQTQYHPSVRKLSKTWQNKAKNRARAAEPEEYHPSVRKLSKTWQDKAKGRAAAAEPEEYHPSVRKLSKTWQDKAKGRSAAAEPEEYHPSVRKLSKTWQDKAAKHRNEPEVYHPNIRKLSLNWQEKARRRNSEKVELEPEEYHPSVRKLSRTWQDKAKARNLDKVEPEPEEYHPNIRKLSRTWQDKAKRRNEPEPEQYDPSIRKLSRTWQEKVKRRNEAEAESPEEYDPSIRRLSKTWLDKTKRRNEPTEEYGPSIRRLSRTWLEKSKRRNSKIEPEEEEPEEYHPRIRKMSRTWQDKVKNKKSRKFESEEEPDESRSLGPGDKWQKGTKKFGYVSRMMSRPGETADNRPLSAESGQFNPPEEEIGVFKKISKFIKEKIFRRKKKRGGIRSVTSGDEGEEGDGEEGDEGDERDEINFSGEHNSPSRASIKESNSRINRVKNISSTRSPAYPSTNTSRRFSATVSRSNGRYLTRNFIAPSTHRHRRGSSRNRSPMYRASTAHLKMRSTHQVIPRSTRRIQEFRPYPTKSNFDENQRGQRMPNCTAHSICWPTVSAQPPRRKVCIAPRPMPIPICQPAINRGACKSILRSRTPRPAALQHKICKPKKRRAVRQSLCPPNYVPMCMPIPTYPPVMDNNPKPKQMCCFQEPIVSQRYAQHGKGVRHHRESPPGPYSYGGMRNSYQPDDDYDDYGPRRQSLNYPPNFQRRNEIRRLPRDDGYDHRRDSYDDYERNDDYNYRNRDRGRRNLRYDGSWQSIPPAPGDRYYDMKFPGCKYQKRITSYSCIMESFESIYIPNEPFPQYSEKKCNYTEKIVYIEKPEEICQPAPKSKRDCFVQTACSGKPRPKLRRPFSVKPCNPTKLRHNCSPPPPRPSPCPPPRQIPCPTPRRIPCPTPRRIPCPTPKPRPIPCPKSSPRPSPCSQHPPRPSPCLQPPPRPSPCSQPPPRPSPCSQPPPRPSPCPPPPCSQPSQPPCCTQQQPSHPCCVQPQPCCTYPPMSNWTIPIPSPCLEPCKPAICFRQPTCPKTAICFPQPTCPKTAICFPIAPPPTCPCPNPANICFPTICPPPPTALCIRQPRVVVNCGPPEPPKTIVLNPLQKVLILPVEPELTCLQAEMEQDQNQPQHSKKSCPQEPNCIENIEPDCKILNQSQLAQLQDPRSKPKCPTFTAKRDGHGQPAQIHSTCEFPTKQSANEILCLFPPPGTTRRAKKCLSSIHDCRDCDCNCPTDLIVIEEEQIKMGNEKRNFEIPTDGLMCLRIPDKIRHKTKVKIAMSPEIRTHKEYANSLLHPIMMRLRGLTSAFQDKSTYCGRLSVPLPYRNNGIYVPNPCFPH